MHPLLRSFFILIVCAPAAWAGSVPPTNIYFTSDITVGSAAAGTNSQRTLMTFPFNQAIGVNFQGGYVYASSYNPSAIWRCGPNGEAPTQLLSRGANVYVRQMQVLNSKLYWNEEGSGNMYRSNLDGSAVENLMTGPTGYGAGIWDFTIANNRFYWTSWDSPYVRSSRMDGTDQQQIFVGGRAFSIESYAGGLVIGTDNSTGLVERMNFDGSGLTVLASEPGVSEMTGLSVYGDRAYFSWSASGGHVASVPLAGGAVQTELTSASPMFQISVPSPGSGVALIAVPVLLANRRRRGPV